MPILKLFIKAFIGKFYLVHYCHFCFLFSQWFHWEGIKSGEAGIALTGLSRGECGTSLSTHYSFLFTSEIFFEYYAFVLTSNANGDRCQRCFQCINMIILVLKRMFSLILLCQSLPSFTLCFSCLIC